MSHCFKREYIASEFETCLGVILRGNKYKVAKSICYDNMLFMTRVSKNQKNVHIFVAKNFAFFGYHILESKNIIRAAKLFKYPIFY